MIWYSVPFVGKKSRKWKEFQDMLLFRDDSPLIQAGILDPRYQKVRDYLTGIYVKAVEEWDLDGLKLDFVDSIVEQGKAPSYNPEKMDFESVQEALDCPDSATRNRVGIVDLRMLSGRTAVHSDPLMWHVDEEPQIAALQVISGIFSTPQISVKLEGMKPDMREMLRFWIGFMRENRVLLQEQSVCAAEPHNLYPVVWTRKDERTIAAVYTENQIYRIPDGIKECILLNGTKGKGIVLHTGGTRGRVTVKDCFGNTVETRETGGCTLVEVAVPVSGQIYWEKNGSAEEI